MKVVYFVALLASVTPTTSITQQDVEGAFSALQQWYNTSNGLWVPSTGWWNSANCLTVIADLAKVDQGVNVQAQSVFSNTYVRAQQYNLQMQKTIGPRYMPQSWYGTQWPWMPPSLSPPAFQVTTGFLNDYYDDEGTMHGWWALAWIAVYDVTGNDQYLQTAETIFEDIAEAYGTPPCGGVWWDKAHTYVNAIANELFLDVAAHLANRAGARSSYYRDWATKQWNWFQNSGLINSEHLVNDGLTNSCVNNGQTIWSYNQGVILAGLAELSRATGDGSYITTAKLIADAAIANLTDENGVLHDACEPDSCGADGSQFKGVFARNLQDLNNASPEARYETFLKNNANSVWTNDRNSEDELSLIWSGPFIQAANASTQSSALDVLVSVLGTTASRAYRKF